MFPFINNTWRRGYYSPSNPNGYYAQQARKKREEEKKKKEGVKGKPSS